MTKVATSPMSSPIPASPANDFDATTVLGYSTTRVPMAYPDDRVSDVLCHLSQADRFESMSDVVVVEAGRLVGLVPIERLLASPAEAPVSAIMDRDPPLVGPGVDEETAVARAVENPDGSLGVVDPDRMFLGLVPPHRMLDVLMARRRGATTRGTGTFAPTTTKRPPIHSAT